MNDMIKIKIGNRFIGEGFPVFIIAEAGVNHNGEERLAFRMIDEAAKAGADAIKFQTFITEETVSPTAPLAEHHIANVEAAHSHFALIKKLELPLKAFIGLKKHAEKKGLIFISTPYDVISAKYLASLDVSAIKIGSAEIENAPLVDTVIKAKKPIILSTGMNTLKAINEVVRKILRNGNKVGILKCTSNYPTDYENVNLLGINTLKNKFRDCVVGFSDHTRGYEVACAAVAMGAKIIEKHFTLSRNMWGPDHKASSDVSEFRTFVQSIRRIEKSLGSEVIKVLPSEKRQKKIMQKAIFARRYIPKGKEISIDDLMFLRPALRGTSSSNYKKIIGKKCLSDIAKGTAIKDKFFR